MDNRPAINTKIRLRFSTCASQISRLSHVAIKKARRLQIRPPAKPASPDAASQRFHNVLPGSATSLAASADKLAPSAAGWHRHREKKREAFGGYSTVAENRRT
jgi:hypothetical protein